MIRRLRAAALGAILFVLALCACTPHPDTVRRELLGLGFGQIKIREVALACAPRAGSRFTATDPLGHFVSGRVCCFRFSCDVVEDDPLNRP